jgi:hypothetical protein
MTSPDLISDLSAAVEAVGKATEGPWEADHDTEHGTGEANAWATIVAADGRVLFDTINGDHVLLIDPDYEGAWRDETGDLNAAAIVAAVNLLREHGDALLQLTKQGWRPIESAPKDGTDILLGCGPQTFRGEPVGLRVTVGHWTTEEECRVQIGDCGGECRCPEYEFEEPSWISWDGGFTAENPATHWQPHPRSPPNDRDHRHSPSR